MIMFATCAWIFGKTGELMLFGSLLVVSGILLFAGMSREKVPEPGL